jgi:GNAT superfamily N-acetyltransferase
VARELDHGIAPERAASLNSPSEIRRLAPADRREWETLFRAYMEFYGRNPAPAVYDKAWAEFLADARIHARGAWLDGKMSGLAHFLVHAHTNANDVCYLQDLFTAPEARGRGIARNLIGYVSDWARMRDCSEVYWQTHVSNARARRVYDQVAVHEGFIVYQIAL